MKNLIIFSFLFVFGVQISESYAQKAKAFLINPKSDTVGSVDFMQTDSGVKLSIEIKDLPSGMHSLHIHNGGKCTPPEFNSAGDHFNPDKREHGFLNPKGPHIGDLPNIEVGTNGTATIEMRTKLFTLKKGEKSSLFNKNPTSIVIHEKADDYITQPSGSGGARIACGEIQEIK